MRSIWATCGNVSVIVMISALSHNTHVFLSEVLYHVITTSNEGKVPNESENEDVYHCNIYLGPIWTCPYLPGILLRNNCQLIH